MDTVTLFLIAFLHQTTTGQTTHLVQKRLFLIAFLHQTTTLCGLPPCPKSCFLLRFYIKPQLAEWTVPQLKVVSYCVSTSNHNGRREQRTWQIVVSYCVSTSNHNLVRSAACPKNVVSYCVSTSNHNS